MKKRLLSGMRPTGPLHLGHLLGALNNWVKLQVDYDCLFMIADWHALMSEYKHPEGIQKNSIEMVKDWIAFGIDPKKSVIFLQSGVAQHLELAMTFSIITPLSWLERCPTYKEQLKELKAKDITTYGFLGYPVLQAADIAVYRAHKVPVGIDQLPHLELTREIVRRFHHLYLPDRQAGLPDRQRGLPRLQAGKKEIFPEPEPVLTKVPKLLGLDNRKMSKSYDNYIALSDSPEVIKKKVSQMITDPKRIKLTDKGHPDVCNPFSYYKVFASKEMIGDVKDWCENAKKGCTECKKILAQIICDQLKGGQQRRSALKDKDVEKILDDGNKKAREIAEDTMRKVKALVLI